MKIPWGDLLAAVLWRGGQVFIVMVLLWSCSAAWDGAW
jgi:hypothetical protein